MRFARALAALALALLAAAPSRAAAPAATARVRVFAAASLTEAFAVIAAGFERAHPGVKVEFNLAGSQQLAAQLEQGAAADVFASADERAMLAAREAGRLAGEPAVFAGNRLALIVPRTNPGRLTSPKDLARRGVRLVLGADAVPAGHYARELLARLGEVPGYPPEYARRALANVASEEENVRAVLTRVQLGEADAGVVYRTDLTPPLARYVRALVLPDSAGVLARYPIATVTGAAHADLARAFVAAVLAPEGQAVLARAGFLPVSALP